MYATIEEADVLEHSFSLNAIVDLNREGDLTGKNNRKN